MGKPAYRTSPGCEIACLACDVRCAILAGEADDAWRAVENLNPDLKMALLLRDVVGLSYTEIGDSLEITLSTVKWRIYKAREEVATALAREGITASTATSTRPVRVAAVAD